jgi:hypothetical protein
MDWRQSISAAGLVACLLLAHSLAALEPAGSDDPPAEVAAAEVLAQSAWPMPPIEG